MKIEYIVPKALTEISVRAFLAQQGFSVHLWRRLKHHGSTFVNGQKVLPAITQLKGNDTLFCDIPESSNVKPINGSLEILWEDDALLFVNKPAGLLVHPLSRGDEATLLNYTAFYFQTTAPFSIPHPMHRLDRNTTGIVMIAKLPQIQHLLTKNGIPMFHRKYLAILQGVMTPSDGIIEAPIARKPASIIERCVSERGKPASTTYRTLAVWDKTYSLVEAQPITGRTHQLRVHFSSRGAPLLGDDLYGGSRELIGRQALHACRMELIHPLTQEKIIIIAPLPEDFSHLLPSDVYHSAKTFLFRK